MQALAAHVGDSLRINSSALNRGILAVEFEWPLADRPAAPLKAVYPDSFPWLRPIVSLRERLTFPKRHCSPIEGVLCLLGRDSRQWTTDWTLATLLTKQLENSLNDTGVEDPQGEPTEYWWNSLGLKNSYCLIDSTWTLGGITAGTLDVHYFANRGENGPEIKALVAAILDSQGQIFQRWTGRLPERFFPVRGIPIPWVYIDEFLLPTGNSQQIDEFVARLPKKPRLEEFGPVSGQMFAVLHKTELTVGTSGLGWIFVFSYGPRKAFRTGKTTPRVNTIPTFRAGDTDLGGRVPATKVLAGKKVVLVGVGAIGAPLAVDLAKNGCSRLNLVDHDVVEPGNSIRWSLGSSAWGRPKVTALADYIQKEYPWTTVVPHIHAVGSRAVEIEGDDALFDKILADADLVVDASTSFGVATLLSEYCRAKALPLVSFYASPPVSGGIVAHFKPQSGCPTCLEFAYHQELFARAPGFGSEEGLHQPPGCAELTFSGGSYDLDELTHQAMRVIVAAAFSDDAEQNNSMIYTLSLPGGAQPPVWRVDELPKIEGCSCKEM